MGILASLVLLLLPVGRQNKVTREVLFAVGNFTPSLKLFCLVLFILEACAVFMLLTHHCKLFLEDASAIL